MFFKLLSLLFFITTLLLLFFPLPEPCRCIQKKTEKTPCEVADQERTFTLPHHSSIQEKRVLSDNDQKSDHVLNTIVTTYFPPSPSTPKNIHSYTHQLLDIFLGKEIPIYEENGHNPHSLSFSLQRPIEKKWISEKSFDHNVSKIYAVFSTFTLNDSVLLAKWHYEKEQVFAFGFESIEQNRENTSIWIKKKRWDKGEYTLELYSPSLEYQKVYEGSFVIY